MTIKNKRAGGPTRPSQMSRNEGWWIVDEIDGEQFRDLFDSSQAFALSVSRCGEASREKSYRAAGAGAGAAVLATWWENERVGCRLRG